MALAGAGVMMAVGAPPAFAASGPPVPAGCTFNQANGVLTCVTATAPTTTSFTLSNTTVTAPATVGGFTVQQVCQFVVHVPVAFATLSVTGDATFDVTAATSTTTERHGLKGNVFNTSTATSSTLDRLHLAEGSFVGCV